MSTRYSNTSSRGRATVIETLTGSTAARSLRAPRAIDRSGGALQPHGLPELAVANALDGHRRRQVPWTAQLADDDVPFVEVDLLADQRRAAAVAATRAVRCEHADADAQELALEIRGLGEALVRRSVRWVAAHAVGFAARRRAPPQPYDRIATTASIMGGGDPRRQ